MASMRKLRRRLLRWERYERAVYGRCLGTSSRGYDRVLKRIEQEEERRFWADTPEIWLGGPAGETALIHDVFDDDFEVDRPGCTLLPPLGISTCYCTNRPGCQMAAADDDLCEFCELPDCMGDCWDEQDDNLDDLRPVETIDTGGLL